MRAIKVILYVVGAVAALFGSVFIVMFVVALVQVVGNRPAATLEAAAAAPAAVAVQAKSDWVPVPTPPPSTCKANWRSCASDEELAKNWGGGWLARFRCQDAANARAKYGEPKWPSHIFGSYRYWADGKTSNLSEGKAILEEPDAQFQNGFGAWEHVDVLCSYDLENDQVNFVTISAREAQQFQPRAGSVGAEAAAEKEREAQSQQPVKRAECHETADIICEHWPSDAAAPKPAGRRGH
jgi:hypothetical protein